MTATVATETDRRSAGRVLAVACLAAFVIYLDSTIVTIAFNSIRAGLSANPQDVSWVLNGYTVAFAAILIPAGRLADRYGRKRTFQLGVVGFAVFSLVCGIAPTLDVLIAARILQAVFAALMVPASLALILPAFAPERRPPAVATWGSMGAASAALGPVLGGLLTDAGSWRWIFFVNVPICLVLLILGRLWLTESRDPSAQGLPDPIGIALLAAIPALLSYSIVEGPTLGWSDPAVLTGLIAAAVCLPVLLLRSARARQPALDLNLLRVRDSSLVNAATLIFGAAFFAVLLADVLFLQSVWHYSVLRSALANTPGPLLVLLVARQGGKAAARFGFRPVLWTGAVIFAVACAGLAVTTGSSPHWVTQWLPWQLLLGLGSGLTVPVQAASAVRPLGPRHFGQGSALNATGRQLGAVIGVSIFIAIQATTGPSGAFRNAWWTFAAVGLASALPLLISSKETTS
jgi:EmrB/QacA subfamily drug resistance transporter